MTKQAKPEMDVVIIGGGSAGLSALRQVQKHTERYAIINEGPWGTTCARVGCMPSKLLIEAATAFHRRHSFGEFGIRGAEQLQVDLPAVLARVRALRDSFVASALQPTQDLGARAIDGRARLSGPGVVQVGERWITAGAIVLAPGSQPVVPAAWRHFGKRLLTTDSLFEQEQLGPRVAVIGLGAIGVEVAQALARLGVQVTAFGRSPQLAGVQDPVVNEVLRQLLLQDMPLHTGVDVTLHAQDSSDDGPIEVRTADGHCVVVDQVVLAMGRKPRLEGLGLDSLGLTLDDKGMPPLNMQSLQVADLPVYLAGDANGGRAVLHESVDEGHIAGVNACASQPQSYIRRTPLAIVFSEPSVAMVGQSWQSLQGQPHVTGTVDFRRQGRARAGQRNQGVLQVYADPESGLLLGAQLCAPGGEHLAHLLALAMEQGMSVQALLGMPFYHPVLEEGLRTALRSAAAQLQRPPSSDLQALAAKAQP